MTHIHPVRRRTTGVAAVLVMVALAVPTGAAAEASRGTPDPPPGPLSPGAPLSGRPIKVDTPVLVVKVDNAPGSAPHAGLNQADLIYVEEVEGGLTRLAAVYSSRYPRVIGPVRSARTDNIQLLKQFGRPEIAYSGANNLVLRAVRHSQLRSIDAESYPRPFRRDRQHRLPHNLFVTNVPALIKLKPGDLAPDIGLRFSTHLSGGRHAARLVVRYQASTLQFDYEARTKHWLISQDGHPYLLTDGSRAFASSVVVQSIKQLRDVNGHITPFNQTIGHGAATVLRDGRAYAAVWRRPLVGQGTRFQDVHTGRDVPLHPGTTWVILKPSSASARVS